MQPHPMSPEDNQDHRHEQQHRGPDRHATPPALLPPRDIYATLPSTLAQPIDADQYYQQVLQELPATHVTLRGWR